MVVDAVAELVGVTVFDDEAERVAVTVLEPLEV